MNEVDRENARRLAIFEAGQQANREGFGEYKNPYNRGLDYVIWRNGWHFEQNSKASTTPGFVLAGVVVLVLIVLYRILIGG